MQTISFFSSHPFDHVPRALDVLRKMQFGLVRLSIEPSEKAFAIAITFEPGGGLSTDVFRGRLGQLEGLVFLPAPMAAGTEGQPHSHPAPASMACH